MVKSEKADPPRRTARKRTRDDSVSDNNDTNEIRVATTSSKGKSHHTPVVEIPVRRPSLRNAAAPPKVKKVRVDSENPEDPYRTITNHLASIASSFHELGQAFAKLQQ